jgi:hypothetical protein
MEKEDYEFEVSINKNFKLRFYDFSLKCSRPDIIIINIEHWTSQGWREIGNANILIEENQTANWMDISIVSEAFILAGIIPNPQYKIPHLRNKGLGSKVVTHVLAYLCECGIKRVYGEISEVDNFEKVSNFWSKNGFTVTRYKQPKGVFVASITHGF